MKTRFFVLGIILVASGFVLLLSHPLNLLGPATLDYGHSILIGFILIGLGVLLLIKEYRKKKIDTKY